MKKSVIVSAVVIALGLFIAFGPQYLFKLCSPAMMSAEISNEDCCEDDGACGCGSAVLSFPVCYWSGRAEIGIGLLIAALGICFIVFTDPKTHLGLTIGVFLSSIIALAIPHVLIGGCNSMSMACRKLSFPVLSIICVITLIGSIIYMILIESKKK